jgi:outer membrane lipoprotein SlyB
MAAPKPVCYDCGTVESMREVAKKGEGTGLGAVAGGIGGLILGHQIGNGAGNKVATVLGAAGGAFAGNAIEKNARTSKSYEVGVLMDDGTRRTVSLASAPTWRTGDHVRVVNGNLEPDGR